MSKLTIDAIQDKLEKLASYDEQSLHQAPMNGEGGLRTLAKGLINRYSQLKKPELIEAILEATKEIRERKAIERLAEENRLEAERLALEEKRLNINVATLTKPELREQIKVNRELNKDQIETPIERAEGIYREIKSIAISSKNLEEAKTRVNRVLLKVVQYETQMYLPDSRKSNKTKIKKHLRELLEADDLLYQQAVSGLLTQFCNEYDAAFSDEIKALNADYRNRVGQQQADLTEFSPQKFFDYAAQVLSNPDHYGWVEVSKALALATGRRAAEIHCSAQFEVTGEYKVRFSGQLKTKGRQDVPESYEIPTLLPATQVVNALEHLESKGKRYSTADEADKKTSKQRSRAMEGTGITYKDLRCIYAEVAAKRFWKPEESEVKTTKNDYFRQILGHAENDVVTANSYQKFWIDGIE